MAVQVTVHTKKLTSSPYISTNVLFGQLQNNLQNKKLIFQDRTNYTFSQIAKTYCTRNEILISQLGYGNEELVHECSPKHTRKGTARMKEDEIKHMKKVRREA